MQLPFRLICFDIETTDLNPILGSIIQLSAIRADEALNPAPEIFNQYIKPLDGYRDSESMEINQIDEQELVKAPRFDKALDDFEFFCRLYEKPVLASWPGSFDIPFLKKQYEKIGRHWPFGHRVFDLKSIAVWEMAKKNKAVAGGLDAFLKELELKFEGQRHDGLADIKNTFRILEAFKKENSQKGLF